MTPWLLAPAGLAAAVYVWYLVDNRHTRHLENREFGERVVLRPRVISVIGELHLERGRDANKGRVIVAGLGPRSETIAPSELPYVLDRYRIRADGDALVVDEVLPSDEEFKTRDCRPIPPSRFDWRGILIRAPRRIDWAHGVAHDWDPDRPRPGLSTPQFPRIVVVGTWMFGDVELRAHGIARARAAPRLQVTNTATGETQGYDLDFLRRAFNARALGIHPTDKIPAPAPPEEPPLATRAQGSSFSVDLGPHLPAPTAPVEYRIVAACGPYRSNEIAIVVQP